MLHEAKVEPKIRDVEEFRAVFTEPIGDEPPIL